MNNIDKLTDEMFDIFNKISVEQSTLEIESVKSDIKRKEIFINTLIKNVGKYSDGVKSKEIYKELCIIKEEVKRLSVLSNNEKVEDVFLITRKKKIAKKLDNTIDFYLGELNKSIQMREANEIEIKRKEEKFKSHILKEVNELINMYLIENKKRVEVQIERLADGYDIEYVIDIIYRLNITERKINEFINNKIKEINSILKFWVKGSYVGNRNYIDERVMQKRIEEILIKNNNRNVNIKDIYIFNYEKEKNMFLGLWNAGGNKIFKVRKYGIKEKFSLEIEAQFQDTKLKIISYLNKYIDEYTNECINQLNQSFKMLFIDVDKVDDVKKTILELKKILLQNRIKIDIRKILI